MRPANTIDYNEHWTRSLDTYKNHPTSRHRRRFVIRAMKKEKLSRDTFIFDYGCGAGILLQEIRSRYRLADSQLGGCDLSTAAIEISRSHIDSPSFYHEAYPEIGRPIDIAITTEVIEHTVQYEEILRWLWGNLRKDGTLIITTPGGTLDPPDIYYGHVQHFRLAELGRQLESIGFSLRIAKCWGFPFFTLQKWITKRNFDAIRDQFMGGDLTTKKRLVFTLAYYLYFVHDLIPLGPQIFILARKLR